MKQGQKAHEVTRLDGALVVEYFAELTHEELMNLLHAVNIPFDFCATGGHYNLVLIPLSAGWELTSSPREQVRLIVAQLKDQINSGALIYVMDHTSDHRGIIVFSLLSTFKVFPKREVVQA